MKALRSRSLLACLLPFATTLGLIARYGINWPVHDQWEYSRALTEGPFPSVFSQQLEHRIPIPRLIWFLLERLTGFNLYIELFLSPLLMLGASFLSLRMLAACGIQGGLRAFAWAWINLILFFPSQGENWLRGDQSAAEHARCRLGR